MASPVRVGLVGLGTIGTGVVRLFQEHGADIDRRLGFPLRLAAIADIDLVTDRGVSLDGYALHRDFKALIDDPAIDIVIELVGGTDVARPKPAPDMVLAACERLAVAPAASWVVGDTAYDRDAARAAGARFAGLGIEGDLTLERLADVLVHL